MAGPGTKDREPPPVGAGVSALDVMLFAMREHFTSAHAARLRFFEAREKHAASRPDLVRESEDHYHMALARAVAVAKECAPYMHARLANVDAKATQKMLIEIVGGMSELMNE